MKLSELRTQEEVLEDQLRDPEFRAEWERQSRASGTKMMPTDPDWVERYLALLGVDHPAPSLDALTRLTRAHVLAVPFENFNAILRRRAHLGRPVPSPDPESLLATWERGAGGALCFDAAAAFGRLLSELGYRARPIMAQISFPGSHQALVVDLDGLRFLVDVGNGAPFLEPIPLDGSFEVRRAGLAYRFRPSDAEETWAQDRWIDGAWAPFCHYDLRPADPRDLESSYQQHCVPGQSWVVDTPVLARSAEDEVWMLRGGELRHFTAEGRTVEPVSDPADYVRLTRDVFHVPALPVEKALAALAEMRYIREADAP